jgi:hypothetical protein
MVRAVSNDHALRVLRHVLTRLQSQPWERNHWDPSRTRAARDDALARFGQIISAERVGGLGKETFLAFLGSDNRRHTMGRSRHLVR